VPDDPLLDLAGSLREDYRAVDWASTPLGPMESWPPSLRHATALAFDTPFPVTLLWGPEFIMVYNAGYVGQIADKHPAALGRPCEDVFPEAWDTIGPLLRRVLGGEPAEWTEDAFFPLERQGFLEETYFTFSYSPVRDEEQRIVGVIDIATETTTQVLARRRLALLSELGEQLAAVQGTAEVLACATAVLRSGVADLPVAEIWLPGLTTRTSGGVLPEAPGTAPGTGDLVLERTATGTVAWLGLGAPTAEGQPLLVVRLNDMLAPDEAYLGFLRLLASTLLQALDRARTEDAERRIAEAQRSISETLQRSLLTEPPIVPGLRIAARYHAATEQAQIGGDWYDAFPVADGAVFAVIGDIAGHDQHAAAEMAQVRSLLRGVALTSGAGPAAVLEALDSAVQDLGMNTIATLVVAVISPPDAAGSRTLRWSNAGHPPPVLVGAASPARLLDTRPDVLLGLTSVSRSEHERALAPGETFLLYTDGLVERRGVSLTDSLDWLTGALDAAPDPLADPLCEHLLGALGHGVEDDVAVLAITACRTTTT